MTEFKLFLYGTLLDDDIFAEVVGRSFAGLWRRPALLPGYRRVCVIGELYPILRPCNKGGVVEGVVIAGLTSTELLRLQYFEGGDEYGLEPIDILIPEEGRIQVLCFYPRDDAVADQTPWTLAQWQRYKEPFLEQTRRYMALYERVDDDYAQRCWQRWQATFGNGRKRFL